MDGRIEGQQMDRQMGVGTVDGWIDRCKNGWKYRWKDKQVDGQTHEYILQMDGWIGRQIERWIDRKIDRRMVDTAYGWVDRRIDRQSDGQIPQIQVDTIDTVSRRTDRRVDTVDGWMDRQSDIHLDENISDFSLKKRVKRS